MAGKSKWHKSPSLCPQCKRRLARKRRVLRLHFEQLHGRLPTSGEVTQFMTHVDSSTPYSERDFVKPRQEISGGGFSLNKFVTTPFQQFTLSQDKELITPRRCGTLMCRSGSSVGYQSDTHRYQTWRRYPC